MEKKSSEILRELLNIGFLTGSRAFGTATEKSDYDIFFSVTDWATIDRIIAGFDRTPSEYFTGFYIKVEDKTLNLIPLHPHEVLPWWLATKAMTATFINSGVVSPIKKYSIFMAIVCAFKGTVEEVITVDAYRLIWNKLRGM